MQHNIIHYNVMQVIGMGKIVTVYLTDEEASELKQFCEENQCSQYSVMKTALKEILFKPTKETIEGPSQTEEEIPELEALEDEILEKDSEDNEISEAEKFTDEEDPNRSIEHSSVTKISKPL